ncbi:MAG TPA: hypothetical protein VML55_09315 [Planctomycetaceae bacterium]|nr:hypothetical protein [Planctomycetaceae bacterium]
MSDADAAGFRVADARAGLFEWSLALAVAAASIATSMAVANFRVGGVESLRFGDLPPAYHDEYSYLFQARTFLAGRTWSPTHPAAPQFFDQMHVLNDDGRYASRYFPGTGAWLMPFVAIGQPYWGHWLAGGLAAFFVFWSGRELAGNGVGLLAGLLTATAPGMAIFSNLLLAHHPTLAALGMFLYAFLRMLRTQSTACAFAAGGGLAFAMLCRPMTAAGFALPFGVWFGVWLLRRDAERDEGRGERDRRGRLGGKRLATLAAMALPLMFAFALLFACNRSITGSGWKSPYGVYQEIYTPRQRYGFDNVERGTPLVGPKVRRAYDAWAENLTPGRAARNSGRRLLASWDWSLGVVPLAMAAAAAAAVPCCIGAAGTHGWFDRRWWLVPAGIVSLHAAHVPYWFSGIIHWHYVFESGPLWLLLFAGVTAWCFGPGAAGGRPALAGWWSVIVLFAVASAWLPGRWLDPVSASGDGTVNSKVRNAVEVVAWPRLKYERFRREIAAHLQRTPAVVFVDPSLEDAHLEYVTNDPHLSGPVLYARLLPEEFARSGVLDAFPGHDAYWVVADEQPGDPVRAGEALRTKLMTGGFEHYRFRLVGGLALREHRAVELWRVSEAREASR